MVEIGARIVSGGRAIAFRVEGAWIFGMAGVAQIDLAAPGIGQAMASGPRRHHAIEHIDAARHGMQNVVGRADAHQIAGTIGRQVRTGHVQDLEHDGLRLAHPQTAHPPAL